MMPGQEANCNNLGVFFFVVVFFNLLDNNGMFSVLIRNISVRQFK